MLVKLGAYTIPEGRSEISRRDTPEFNAAGQVLSNTIRLDVSTALTATSPDSMDRAVKSLLQAFSLQGRDFLVYLPGGTVSSQLTLRGTGAISAPRIVNPPTIESLKNAGYVTWLPINFSVEAVYAGANASSLYREFSESITYDAPTRREAWLLCLHGSHQKQRIRERPFYRAVQSGHAVGFLGYPAISSVIWPQFWMNPDQLPDRKGPRPRGDTLIDYEISWSRTYESDTPLIANPAAWPI